MKLTVLEDNNTYIDRYFLGEPAVSYYIEDGDTGILFDAAYSDAYVKNAGKMGIDLGSVDKIVLSHGHNDHTQGLLYFPFGAKRPELIAHPLALERKELPDGEPIGSPMGIDELAEHFEPALTAEPVRISENIVFLGEIPVSFDFEKRYSIGCTVTEGERKEDYLHDDSAVVYRSDKGLFIITGCSHSGICNIIEYAKKVCRDERIYGVIGGFHLFETDERLIKTISYLKDNGIELLYPCHCVSLKAKTEMAKELDIIEVGVGLELAL